MKGLCEKCTTKHILISLFITCLLLLPACEESHYYPPPPPPTETISSPSTPTGPSAGYANEALTYTTGGSTSSLGYSVQYRFNWGDGGYSNWLSSPSTSHSWASPGNYMVTAQARSAVNHDILSDWAGGKSVTIEELIQPLNVRIDYIGVKDAHGGNVQLVVVVGDEDEDKMETLLIPPVKMGYSMGDFDTKTIDQRVFHTSSIKGNLKMTILAYHRDQSKTDYLTLINWMKWYYGDNIDWLEQLVLNMPEQDELIGYYEYTWYPDENWGIGQHDKVGHDDFVVGFSIYSGEEPPLLPEPSTLPGEPEVQTLECHMGPGYFAGSYAQYSKQLQVGEKVTGSLRLTGYYPSSDWDYTCCFWVYSPEGNCIHEWCEDFKEDELYHEFSFTASYSGKYTIQVKHCSYHARELHIEVSPYGWD